MQIDKAIELKAVSKKYPFIRAASNDINRNFKDFWALKDVSLDVYQGKISGIIGRNGAGKTTLLNIIAGVLSPTQGEVFVSGKVLGLFNLGVGFQDELTGKENVFLNGTVLGATKKDLEDKLSSIIEFSELGDFINMPLGTYSQGMRLRLAFSIIANLDFDILAIDEILAVGDALFQNKCFQRLMDFRRSGKTLIMTTQSMELIERLCDKVALLDHGHMLFYGSSLEGINRYRSLLNTEKFFVGPAQKGINLVENTQKWADDLSNWGKKFGTKEVVIDSVKFINKFGFRCNRIRSGDSLKVKVYFTAKDKVKDAHFGIAIFRNDGVYCYGPNTEFDGYRIPEIKPGKGWFILDYKKILLAPSKYRLSVAIWDKNETLAFDYHCGYYDLTVTGYNKESKLLNLPFRIYPTEYFTFYKKFCPNLGLLNDKWEEKIESDGIRLELVKLLNFSGEIKKVFKTNESVKFIINFSELRIQNKNTFLWVGIYRDDRIYCQGIMRAFNKNKLFQILFPSMLLLPGGYRISLGIWDSAEKKFIMCHHAVYPFRMIFNREDHGTIYLEHKWKWKLPK